MDYSENYQYGTVVANAAATDRADFIRKTYMHLTGAVIAFALLETAFLYTPMGATIVGMLGGSRYGWLLVMLAFMGVSYVANSWAQSATSSAMQYAGLGLYVVAESVIMCPLIWIAYTYFPLALPAAAIITLALFGGLTFVVFITGKDFSFMSGALSMLMLLALGFVVCGVIFGFTMPLAFSVAMAGLACGYILYDTSNVIHHYRVGQHVAASLALFASVALLFWYVLRLVMASRK